MVTEVGVARVFVGAVQLAALSCDTDQDGYGNPCRGELDHSNTVWGATDFSEFFLPDFTAGTNSCIGTDMDCSGVAASDFSALASPRFRFGLGVRG
jgi:hypothetical protein